MVAWLRVVWVLLLCASGVEAQAAQPSRFGASVPTFAGAFPAPSPVPSLCNQSKRVTVVRGAVGGFLLVGGATFVVALVRSASRAATFRSSMERVPVFELAAGGALVGAILEGAEWERQCG